MTFPLASIADLFDEFELAKLAPAVAVTSLQAVAQFQQSPSLISTDPIFFPLSFSGEDPLRVGRALLQHGALLQQGLCRPRDLEGTAPAPPRPGNKGAMLI